MSETLSIERPKLGVGLIIIKEQTLVLLGKRLGSHGSQEYGGVGGHMENGESFAETALREMREEIGDDIQITTPEFLCVSNIRRYFPKHYVDIGMIANWISGKPIIMEPSKIENWGWYPLDDVPQPLFEPVKFYLQALKTGKVLFDIN